MSTTPPPPPPNQRQHHKDPSFGIEELTYWQQYGIDAKTLQRFHVNSLTRYEAISNQGKPFTLVSTLEEPMFAYSMGKFVKVYRPKSKLRFLYGGEKVNDYVFGFQQLPSKGDVVFITGGEKDVRRPRFLRISSKDCSSAFATLLYCTTLMRQA